MGWSFSGIHEELSQKITMTPKVTPVAAAAFPALFTMSQSRNRPSMPPAKIPDSCHQISRIFLVLLVRSRAVLVPIMPQTMVATLKTNIAYLSVTACARRNSRVQRSLSVIVAELFRLVSMVLMAAAASAAMMSPPRPVGKW